MRRRFVRNAAALAAGIALCTATGLAAERTHRVRAGESVSSIAKRYYGSFEPAELVLRYNGRSEPVIHPGETLRIPYCETHAIRAGDTWSVLAERYLGRADAYPAIAALNGLDPASPLRVGQKIVMPVVLPHRLARGESLSAVSEKYYGTIGLSSMLATFNAIEDVRRLSVGQTLEIPLITLAPANVEAVARTTPVEEPPVRPAAAPRPEPRFAKELGVIREAFDRGEYGRARELLDGLDERIDSSSDAAERREFWELRAFVHVAFDEARKACAAYVKARGATTPAPFDPDRVSPKIRSVLEHCS